MMCGSEEAQYNQNQYTWADDPQIEDNYNC